MSRRSHSAILVLATLVTPLLAPARGASEPALRLGTGDRVLVQVFGQPEISGEFTVDTQGNITLPIGGAVPAVEATPADLQRFIVDLLADGIVLRPRVSVRVVEFRPVYVIGDVRLSGALTFRAGMTALAAIAMAGGPASTDPQTAAFRGDLLDAVERVGLLEGQRAAIRARIARLEAQQQGAEAPIFPEDIQAGGPEMQRIMAGERSLFEAERESELRQAELITQQRVSADSEMASLAEQLRLERGQLEVSRGYEREMASLARTGVVDRRRLVDSQREVARIESSVARLTTESARAAQIGQDSPLRLAQLRGAAEQRALVGLQEARARLAEIENGILAGREQITLRSQRIEAAIDARPGAPPQMLVTRAQQGAAVTIVANDGTPLLPGDILRVSGGAGIRPVQDRPIQPDPRRP